ncbi:hypothetical protein X975_01867, partial [Stegodyphus mimosarum]
MVWVRISLYRRKPTPVYLILIATACLFFQFLLCVMSEHVFLHQYKILQLTSTII